MSEQRRATVMIIQRGDREITGALMAGVIAARGNRDIERPENSPVDCMDASIDTLRVLQRDGAGRPLGTGNRDSVPEAQPVDTLDVYTVQEDKWRRVARQVHVAIGNTKTPEDYCQLIVKARGDYAIHTRSGPLHTVAGKLLLAWALLWQGIWRAYDAQEKVLRP